MKRSSKNTLLSNEELLQLREEVEKEFPNDFALQEIHLSRKILSLEAEKLGIDYLQYVQQEANEFK